MIFIHLLWSLVLIFVWDYDGNSLQRYACNSNSNNYYYYYYCLKKPSFSTSLCAVRLHEISDRRVINQIFLIWNYRGISHICDININIHTSIYTHRYTYIPKISVFLHKSKLLEDESLLTSGDFS